ncbi:Toxin HigB-2 [compost metagenome]
MEAVFVELPPFQRYRTDYLDDEAFRSLQSVLMKKPEAGGVIQGAGGLRKVRFGDGSRHKGKRGGIRIIYYWWQGGTQFWLFTLYGKDEQSDLSSDQRKALRRLLEREAAARIHNETRHIF